MCRPLLSHVEEIGADAVPPFVLHHLRAQFIHTTIVAEKHGHRQDQVVAVAELEVVYLAMVSRLISISGNSQPAYHACRTSPVHNQWTNMAFAMEKD